MKTFKMRQHMQFDILLTSDIRVSIAFQITCQEFSI